MKYDNTRSYLKLNCGRGMMLQLDSFPSIQQREKKTGRGVLQIHKEFDLNMVMLCSTTCCPRSLAAS